MSVSTVGLLRIFSLRLLPLSTFKESIVMSCSNSNYNNYYYYYY
jgi:hypothetical protein